ncbi:type VII secretion protein EccE [Mycobacterium saskatchewanense]|uniref:Type VII secretion protein EccE n=1 Tax=Mycobacterium saskatchewanense TaxID=220927 RepID=A0AAJ3NTA1_9MYCO|nr:type VII secretion protein EccE [Mycobacterium saskatchewanense]ORW73330.1 type VII secretion protein EccE [Mycobacterium saskatchewanense]BBX64723.1 type VII secretion protein EccE [Mycobacterium saskatchewanense]
MSVLRSIPPVGSGRVALALLAVVPAVMAYPWRTAREQWVLGIAVAVVVALFGWWRGMHFTTILGRRLAIARRRSRFVADSGAATKATVLLRVGAPGDDADVLPLPLLAGYLDRYGVRADKIRITSRDNASEPARRETWIALTLSAVDNLAALRARSPRIPLHETAQVAARRLADHLREIGWEAATVGPDDVPRLLSPSARETWRGVQRGASDYIAAYRVRVDEALPGTLDAIRTHPARESCTALEIAGEPARPTVAAACAFLTETPPAGAAPVAGLIPQSGDQRPALAALDLLSTARLEGHTEAPVDLLALLRWPTPAAGAHRATV